MTLKNNNKKPKLTRKPKKISSSFLIFFRQFQGTKTSKWNSSHQMKTFNTKIDYFNDRNWCQHQFSLSGAKIWRPLFLALLSNQELRNNKNKFLYQNWIEKTLRDRICIVCKLLCELWNHHLFMTSFLLWSLSFNFVLNQQIWSNCPSIWSKKDAIAQKKNVRTKLKKSKILNSEFTVKCEKVNNERVLSILITSFRFTY
jgi:hypothetical protein